MSIGKRINQRRTELKLSADKLGEMIGKNRATIYRYESNEIENMPYDVVEPLAKALNVSPAYLMGWDKPTNIIDVSQETVRIPVLGTIACGDPILAKENIEEYRTTLKADIPSGDVFYLRAKGDSMAPLIPDGAMVLLRYQKDVETGEIAAVMLNGDEEATLKRVKKQGDVIMLVPENNQHDIIIASKENPINIIGKVVEIRIIV